MHQGAVVVRQRMGLLVPGTRSGQIRGRQGCLELRGVTDYGQVFERFLSVGCIRTGRSAGNRPIYRRSDAVRQSEWNGNRAGNTGWDLSSRWGPINGGRKAIDLFGTGRKGISGPFLS